MKRFPAYDPPEYLEWEPDPEELERYRDPFRDEERSAKLAALGREDHLSLYAHLLRTRLFDIGLKRWVRTGVISKAWLGTGEEAVTVGNVYALDRDRDVVCPMIRNAGALPMMGMSLASCFRGYLASVDSPSGGRDLHVGDLSKNVLQPISHMGTNVQVISGIALSFRNRDEDRVAMTWIGDGATRTGAAHEGISVAAWMKVPAVFVVQDNQVALGTRTLQHGAIDFEGWATAYGLPCWTCDGNNVLDVYAATALAVERCRHGGGPAVVLARTFRMGGHATHDEREARETFEPELFKAWGRRDPVGLFEAWLTSQDVSQSELARLEAEVTSEVDNAADQALESRNDHPEPNAVFYDGFSEGSPLISIKNRPFNLP